jgi:hypothetical protein
MLEQAVESLRYRRTMTSPIFTLSSAPWCRMKTYSIGPARASRRRSFWVVWFLSPLARRRSLHATRPTSTEATTMSGVPTVGRVCRPSLYQRTSDNPSFSAHSSE